MIGYYHLIINLFGKIAETASKHYAHGGQFLAYARFHIARGMVDSFGSFVHSVIAYV